MIHGTHSADGDWRSAVVRCSSNGAIKHGRYGTSHTTSDWASLLLNSKCKTENTLLREKPPHTFFIRQRWKLGNLFIFPRYFTTFTVFFVSLRNWKFVPSKPSRKSKECFLTSRSKKRIKRRRLFANCYLFKQSTAFRAARNMKTFPNAKSTLGYSPEDFGGALLSSFLRSEDGKWVRGPRRRRAIEIIRLNPCISNAASLIIICHICFQLNNFIHRYIQWVYWYIKRILFSRSLLKAEFCFTKNYFFKFQNLMIIRRFDPKAEQYWM